MKEFRKNQDGHFICEECGKQCVSIKGLAYHVSFKHNNKEYFDRWIKDENEDECKVCKKPTKFINFHHGYKNCCSNNCTKKLRNISYKKTCVERYGTTNFNNHQKTVNTLIKKYGVKNSYQLKHNRKKARETYIKRFNGNTPFCDIEVHKKAQETIFKKYKYIDTNLTYQGSYELDFLEKFYNKIDIENGPTISYNYKKNKKLYYPDFYLPSINLIIEIKNSYLFERDFNIIKTKEKATISNGFNYIIIIDKNYSEFNKLITLHHGYN